MSTSILEGADSAEAPPDAVDIQRTWVLPVSAKTEAAVRELARRYARAAARRRDAAPAHLRRPGGQLPRPPCPAARRWSVATPRASGGSACVSWRLERLLSARYATASPADGPVFVYYRPGRAVARHGHRPAATRAGLPLETIRLCDRHMRSGPVGRSKPGCSGRRGVPLHLTEMLNRRFSPSGRPHRIPAPLGVSTPGAVVGHSMGEDVAAAWYAGAWTCARRCRSSITAPTP
ncbi:hypothetical protein ACPA9J_27410 [Pseudomonas aeruginosa]